MLPNGTRVGRYRIESLLGAGGMGEVYDAVDTSLGRRVALKLLPADVATDPARVERFLREAEAASALDHPAIVTVYDAGSAAIGGGEREVSFLAMERLDGEPLAAWMRRNRDLARGLELMADVADGLARAHACGIVHRDLKPENIVVARGGYAKVVDFGVAKLTERATGGNGHGDTAPTSIIGTAAYMSPEQVEGRPVDARSDVFSFGCVLYELVTGRSPFAAARQVDALHNVVHLAPPPAEGAPPELQRVLRKCLAKDPDERYHSIKDTALDLREVARGLKDVKHRRSASYRRAILPVALLLVVLAGAVWQIRQARLAAGEEAPRQAIMSRITNSGRIGNAAISPDGRYAAYTTLDGDLQSIWIKQIATGTSARVLPPAPLYVYDLRFSPDGNYIYYSAAMRSEPNVNDVFEISALGGEPRRVAHDIELGFGISPDGKQLAVRHFSAVTRETVVVLVDVDTGAEHALFRRMFPQLVGEFAWSPDGKSIAYIGGDIASKPKIGCFAFDLAARQERLLFWSPWPNVGGLVWLPDGSGLVVNAYDRLQPPQVWVMPLQGEPRKITSDVSAYGSPSITADGKSLALLRAERSANLWRVDLAAPRTRQPLTTGLGNMFGLGGVRALADGRVIFTDMAKGRPTLAVIAAAGQPQPLVREGTAWAPEISPDGQHMAFVSERSGLVDVWYSDLDGGNARQLTRQMTRASAPSFLPDGKSLVFISNGNVQAAWQVNIDGTGLRRLTDRPANMSAVSPDGKYLLCRLRSLEPNVQLWRTALIPMAGGAVRFYSVPLFGGPPIFRWRADGRAFAFVDFQGGVANIWLQEFEGGEPKQLTFFDAGQIYAFDWSRDGNSFVFSGGDPATDAVLISNFR